MSFLARWAGPFAGATAALGAVIGFVVLGEGGPQVPVPAAAVVHAATTSADDDHPESSPPSQPFTVVYPKRTVDVVEVPGADDGPDRIDGGGSGLSSPSQSLPPTPSAVDGGDQARPPAGATPTGGERESDDSRGSGDHSSTPRPLSAPTTGSSGTRTPSPTWTNDDEGDGAHTPDS